VDKGDADEKAKEKASLIDDDEEEGKEEDKKDELKSVTVKFKKKESERSLAYRQLSHAYYKQMSEKEPWVDLKVHDKDVCTLTSPHADISL
jgi:isopropylmalate/homocitrate/citramalate synthase